MLALLGFVAGRRNVHAAGIADGAMNIGSAILFFAWLAWARTQRPSLLEVAKISDEVVLAA